MFEYVSKVLTALGINYGCSHSEVFLLTNGDICLCETGARMHGGKGPYHAMLNREHTQVDLT